VLLTAGVVGAGGVEPPAPSVSGTRGIVRRPAQTKKLASQTRFLSGCTLAVRLVFQTSLGTGRVFVGRPSGASTSVSPQATATPRGQGHEGSASCPPMTVPVADTCCWVDVTQAVREASDPNLPIEPGVRKGHDALVRWTVLLEAVIP